MNERIKELAEQAGLDMTYPHCIEGDIDDLQRFAELVRQDEREACAKVCESLPNFAITEFGSIMTGPQHCATAIRARSMHD